MGTMTRDWGGNIHGRFVTDQIKGAAMIKKAERVKQLKAHGPLNDKTYI